MSIYIKVVFGLLGIEIKYFQVMCKKMGASLCNFPLSFHHFKILQSPGPP